MAREIGVAIKEHLRHSHTLILTTLLIVDLVTTTINSGGMGKLNLVSFEIGSIREQVSTEENRKPSFCPNTCTCVNMVVQYCTTLLQLV